MKRLLVLGMGVVVATFMLTWIQMGCSSNSTPVSSNKGGGGSAPTSTFTPANTATLTRTFTPTGPTSTPTVTLTPTITNTPGSPTATPTVTVTNTPGAGATPFTLYQCGSWSSNYGSVATGGTNVPGYTVQFTGNPDNLDTACFSGTGYNFDIGLPPGGAVAGYLQILPSTATVNLTGLTHCSFDAWCSAAIGVSFGVALSSGDTASIQSITMSSTWTNYQISLTTADLSAVATLFEVQYSGANGQNLALDQIMFY